uniref:Uncharacterized protein n=1 Tax=Cyclophora tenuis TaxID=216820 RepID=A0A7S1DCZ1_CYCTE|mmetsp:Transcript_7175/g.12483  ORF Transcript_7175/g.12483 Transcript_7175/m.12483 type:complete len:283 (+) Transcript_7175:3-851(+)
MWRQATVAQFKTRRMVARGRRHMLCLTAALGSTLPNGAYSFVGPPAFAELKHQASLTPVRLFSNNNKNNDNKGLFGGIGKVVKGVLPKSWTQTKEERKVELQRRERREEMSSNIQSLLRDAPFPVRMMGSMISPLVSGMVSSLAETMSAQQQQMDQLLDDAKSYLLGDPIAVEQLGTPIVVQTPFSQSSSTSSINGNTTTQIQASFAVQGSRQQGIVTMTANEAGIQQLMLQVGGRNISVQLSRKGSSSTSDTFRSSGTTSLGKNRINKDDIIDAEFVEKKN